SQAVIRVEVGIDEGSEPRGWDAGIAPRVRHLLPVSGSGSQAQARVAVGDHREIDGRLTRVEASHSGARRVVLDEDGHLSETKRRSADRLRLLGRLPVLPLRLVRAFLRHGGARLGTGLERRLLRWAAFE